jgi:hypothetical protein
MPFSTFRRGSNPQILVVALNFFNDILKFPYFYYGVGKGLLLSIPMFLFPVGFNKRANSNPVFSL